MAKLVANIANKCNPVKGLKEKIWLFNRTDFTFTKTNNVLSGIAKIGSVVGYTALGKKDYANAGYEAKVFDNVCTAFKHKIMLNLTVGSAAEQANIDQAEDLVVVGQSNDGSLYAFGVNYGLYKASQSQMSNDNNGLQAVEFSTREGIEEPYSIYFVTLTPAQLDALTV